MYFEKDELYHVFNQGNNRQKIFFSHDNYLYFLGKIRKHILPYADVLAYCLMPNHFHLMIKVRVVSRASLGAKPLIDGEALGEKEKARASLKARPLLKRTLNDSIGVMLRSYTNAINKREVRSGSLFRKETKAKCLTMAEEGLSPSWFHSTFGTIMNTGGQDTNYPQQCFNYIHQNPVAAGLVDKAEDWEFSAMREYLGLRSESLVNLELAKELGLWV